MFNFFASVTLVIFSIIPNVAMAFEVYGPYPITLKDYQGPETNSVNYSEQISQHLLHSSLKKAISSGASLEVMNRYFNGAEEELLILDPISSDDLEVLNQESKGENITEGGESNPTEEPLKTNQESDENKELIVDSSNNHNHILKDNSHNHVGIDISNISLNVTDVAKDSIYYTDRDSSNYNPYYKDGNENFLKTNIRESASADIPEHNHTMDPSGSHIHTFENDDDETCPNFIYMLPCIKF